MPCLVVGGCEISLQFTAIGNLNFLFQFLTSLLTRTGGFTQTGYTVSTTMLEVPRGNLPLQKTTSGTLSAGLKPEAGTGELQVSFPYQSAPTRNNMIPTVSSVSCPCFFNFALFLLSEFTCFSNYLQRVYFSQIN